MRNTSKPSAPLSPLVRRILRKILGYERYTLFTGRHEYTSIDIWGIVSSDLNDGDAILDIGAYIGEYSIKARQNNSNAKIHAFEPNEQNTALLRKNIKGLNIIVSNLALSDKCEKALFLNEGKISQIIDNKNYNSNTLEVETITLDKYQKKSNLNIKLVKIDTEGQELKILKKSSKVLKEFKPIICCEVLTEDKGSKLTNLLSKEYIFYSVDEKYKKITKKSLIDRKLWRNRNWFFVPIEKKTHFEKLIKSHGLIEIN